MKQGRFMHTFHMLRAITRADNRDAQVLIKFYDQDHETAMYFVVSDITTETGSRFHSDADIIITADATAPVVAGTMRGKEGAHKRPIDESWFGNLDLPRKLPEPGTERKPEGSEPERKQSWLAIGDKVEVWTPTLQLRAYTGILRGEEGDRAIVEVDEEYRGSTPETQRPHRGLVFARGTASKQVTDDMRAHGWEWCEACYLWFAPGTHKETPA